MWALNNTTPYGAERTWWRDSTGAHHWLVGVQATFEAQPGGSLRLTDEQPPPELAPEYWEEPGQSSLRCEARLVHPKPTTDVLVEASAYAPQGKPAASVPVGLRIHNLPRKELRVFGTRAYFSGLTGLSTTSPHPFISRPLRYEGAYGGTDTSSADPSAHSADLRNPVGKGYAKKNSTLDNQEAHYIEYVNGHAKKAGPAGFGPIDRHWLPRNPFAGTYDAEWETRQKPLLPVDYDPRFMLCAPHDQRPLKPLYGGERIELVHLTPPSFSSSGAWVFDLPKIYLTFRTHFGSRSEEHRSRLSTVFIDAERQRVSLTWISSLAVKARDADYLDQTRVGEKAYVT